MNKTNRVASCHQTKPLNLIYSQFTVVSEYAESIMRIRQEHFSYSPNTPINISFQEDRISKKPSHAIVPLSNKSESNSAMGIMLCFTYFTVFSKAI